MFTFVSLFLVRSMFVAIAVCETNTQPLHRGPEKAFQYSINRWERPATYPALCSAAVRVGQRSRCSLSVFLLQDIRSIASWTRLGREWGNMWAAPAVRLASDDVRLSRPTSSPQWYEQAHSSEQSTGNITTNPKEQRAGEFLIKTRKQATEVDLRQQP